MSLTCVSLLDTCCCCRTSSIGSWAAANNRVLDRYSYSAGGAYIYTKNIPPATSSSGQGCLQLLSQLTSLIHTHCGVGTSQIARVAVIVDGVVVSSSLKLAYINRLHAGYGGIVFVQCSRWKAIHIS